MSLQSPKIDNRTYDDIVEQTVKLGQHFTVQDSSDVVANKLEELLDRTIAEDIKDAEGKIIAAAGTLIDGKIADALVKIESLNQVKVNSKGWCKADKPDAGLALIRIFGRMAALVSDRLNQVPEKNFLAFLNLIGTQILPPQPARVPLTFSLAAGAKVDALVPARTQVAAPATAGEQEEVVFETERDLVVTPVQLQAVFVRQPDADCYSNHTPQPKDKENTAFPVFEGDRLLEHYLYLACDELFTLPAPKNVVLTIASPDAVNLAALPLTWSYWDGTTWQWLSNQPLNSVTITSGKTQIEVAPVSVVDSQGQKITLDRKTVDLSQYTNQTVIVAVSYSEKNPVIFTQAEVSKYPDETYIRLARLVIDANGQVSQSVTPSSSNGQWTVSFLDLPTPTPCEINGLNAAWLRAHLQAPLPHQEILSLDDQVIVIAAVAANRQRFDLNAPFYPFGQTEPLSKFFFLGIEEVSEQANGTVSFTLSLVKYVAASINSQLELSWSYRNGDKWELLGRSSPVSPSLNDSKTFTDETKALTQDGIISFAIPPNWQPIKGIHWLLVQITDGDYGTGANFQPPQIKPLNLPRIGKITATVHVENNPLAPKLCFFNSTPIDLSKDFYPFGEQPRLNDTIYLALDEAFAKPNAKVMVDVKLSAPPPLPVNPSDDLQIKWETWNGNDWDVLSISDQTQKSSDQTQNFTKNGQVSFTLPSKVAAKTINGESNYWIRARIVKGNYGTTASSKQRTLYDGSTKLSEASKSDKNELVVEDVTGFQGGNIIWIEPGSNHQENHEIESVSATNKKITLKTNLVNGHDEGTSVLRNPYFVYDPIPATLGPPSLQSLKLSYTYDFIAPLSACLTYNDFTYVDRTSEASKDDSSFSPFTPTEVEQPSLYLGFDQPFSNKPVALYAQVEPLTPEEAREPRHATSVPRLVWEYASPTGWKRLSVQDETNAFAERGMIRFIGPPDFTVRAEFGQSLYWLRVYKESGEFRVEPRLRRLLTNTTWASQTTTIENENLGSSNGNPNQTFRTTNSPVLLGQRLEVQEQEVPSSAEQSAIEQLEGADAVTILRDEAGHPEAVWVRWHEVSDFYSSGPRDRHYIINRLTGEVLFGDGQQGMVPPIGRNNIRMSLYQIGGGKRGNQGAKTVTQLKTTVPYIDSVTNLEAAGGGADLEPLERVKERGPKVLRHRGRAVTMQDFEDLAYEASPDVARVKAIAPNQIKQVTNGTEKPIALDPLNPDLWLDPKNNNPNLDEHKKVQNVGQVTLLIVPNTSTPQPVPSLALIEQVETYIRARCNPTINLVVAGPDWQQVSVTAEVVPVSLDVADAVRVAVIKRLEEFLHPLTGGKQGQGWAFGRQPQMSDLYVVIEAVQGVDHIHSLVMKPEVNSLFSNPNQLVYSGIHTITILFEEGV